MPKRPPTPPATDDSQFFTVVNPYPDQPYEALEDSITFARWLACVVGEENLIAFYHKPKSPNVVVIEVSKEGVNLRRLLGEHRWSEMLRKPSKEEAAEVSSIFPCKKNTGWSLEKIRWLRRDVESSWFKNWSPAEDAAITYPYPDSHFCHPPAEDVTGTRMCCPLRQEMFSDSNAQPMSVRVPVCRSASAVTSRSSDCLANELPLPPGLPPPHFVPAIHGIDVPKAVMVAVDVAPMPVETSLWSGYDDETERAAQDDLCAAHNVLCHRGICKLCAARKRAEVMAERARERQKEKDAWNRRREGRGGRPQSQASHGTSSDASSRSGSPGALEASPGGSGRNTGKSQLTLESLASRKESKAQPTNSRMNNASAASRTLPAHLRKGGSKTDTASSSSISIRSSSTSSSSSSSRAPTTDDAQSTSSSSYDSPSSKSESDSSSPRSLHVPAPWAKTFNAWHSHAKLAADDASSVASGETRDAFRNPWKRVAPVQAARPRWGDAVSDISSSERGSPRAWSGRDDDTESVVSDFDEEPF